ncbi:MAG TPA: hypothetical protein PKY35_10260 [Candidatus Hydrogenedentes bacterium]|nr:hypothetical protein [Candidatus Hydrogenedentota bacterium]HOL77403.1 hypothetical protein [Candidatus Hydrogenedentota bacterium]
MDRILFRIHGVRVTHDGVQLSFILTQGGVRRFSMFVALRLEVMVGQAAVKSQSG